MTEDGATEIESLAAQLAVDGFMCIERVESGDDIADTWQRDEAIVYLIRSAGNWSVGIGRETWHGGFELLEIVDGLLGQEGQPLLDRVRAASAAELDAATLRAAARKVEGRRPPLRWRI